jgi:hypothetical protein
MLTNFKITRNTTILSSNLDQKLSDRIRKVNLIICFYCINFSSFFSERIKIKEELKLDHERAIAKAEQ